MWSRIAAYVRLPSEVTDFERQYLARMNRIGLWFFVAHLPVFVLVAFFNDTGPLSAVALTSFVLVGPVLAYKTFKSPRLVSVSYGVTAMLMGGLLVHFGQGPVQIEMHFYFFALLAMLAMFGNPMVIVTAAVTVALHHLLLWLYLPTSVFNYDAPIWVVAIHAAFVVLESVATCFIARSFFDNVIGLEKIVQSRTAALDKRNQDMRVLLDNVQQGFLTLDRSGALAAERSAAVSRWFGGDDAADLGDLVEAKAPAFAENFRVAWEQVEEDLLPVECNLDLAPSRIEFEDRTLQVDYQPMSSDASTDDWSGVLVVMSDITSQLEHERLESEQREVLYILDRILKDKAGFLEFFEEAKRQIQLIVSDEIEQMPLLKRVIHTLKGNAAVFGIHRISDRCHAIEEALKEEGGRPSAELRESLAQAWDRLCESLDVLLGGEESSKIEVDDDQFKNVLREVLENAPREQIAESMVAWKLEPTVRRLERLASQVHRIGARLDKQNIAVEVDGHGLRQDAEAWAPFWSSYIHLLRNAVDHGLESIEERRALGKEGSGHIRLETVMEGDEFIVRLTDDGRGIDWTRVAEKATRLGLPTEDRDDLVRALFHDGLSTRDDVTSTSGRGVGLAAVHEACEAVGGQIDVDSKIGAGTTFVCRFPSSALAVKHPEVFLAA
ncbi:MAG: ATP-binding protein [Deltaproteobacteria bacterium]|jgi:two-component system chemotaxis sensor kinase CheA